MCVRPHARSIQCLALALLLSGCASYQPKSAFLASPSLRNIEVAIGDFAPDAAHLKAPQVAGKTLKAGLAGAAPGAIGMAMTAPTCTNPFTVGICVVYMPVFALMTVAGGTTTAVGEKSAQQMHEHAQKAMDGLFDASAMQQALQNQVLDYAHTTSLRNFRSADTPVGGSKPDARLEVAVTAVDGIDVQAGAFELLSTHYALVLEARARLHAGTEVLQDRTYRYVSAPGTAEAWAADAGRRMRDELEQGHAQFAEWIVDDFFRGRVARERLRAPRTVLPKASFAFFGPYTKSGFRHPTDTGTLTPTLAWRNVLDEAVPDPSLRHEVKVYRADKIGRYLWAMSPFYVRRGLDGSSHRLEAALDPCAHYIWTVRSMRPRNGESEVSEWWGIWLESMPEGLRQAEPKIDHGSVFRINSTRVLDQRLANYGSPLATPCAEVLPGNSLLPWQASPEALPIRTQAATSDLARALDATLVTMTPRTSGLGGVAKGLELGIRLYNRSEQALPGLRIKVDLRDASGVALGSFDLQTGPFSAGETREIRHTLYPLLFTGLARLRALPLEQVRAQFTFSRLEPLPGLLPH